MYGKIDNTLKLSGYGVYVARMHGVLWISKIVPSTNGPTLDYDGCIEWCELNDPPNQAFLDIINSEFGLSLTMMHYGKYMTIGEICKGNRAHVV